MDELKVSLDAVVTPFVGRDQMTTRQLVRQLALDLDVPDSLRSARKPVGQAGKPYNLFERKVRWHQQTLKRMGVLEHVDRGVWRLSNQARKDLTPAPPKSILLAFSTDLGCALWANAEDVLAGMGKQITLAFTSPPYPLAKQRAYGGPGRQKYIDWLLSVLEPVVANLRPGGSIVLNLSNDIFEEGSPARSLYLERLTLALHDQLGLHLMERFVWHNPSKPPGPVQWASLHRIHHNVAYEPVLWFTNDPHQVIADNRLCLQEHTQQQKRLMAAGGVQQYARHAGGAYTVRPGSFGNQTAGAIARNVLKIPHNCPYQKPVRDFAKEHGYPLHPALMPLELAEHFVRYLSRVGDLVVDFFSGWGTTGQAAELNDRRWLLIERIREYLPPAAERFRGRAGFQNFTKIGKEL